MNPAPKVGWEELEHRIFQLKMRGFCCGCRVDCSVLWETGQSNTELNSLSGYCTGCDL